MRPLIAVLLIGVVAVGLGSASPQGAKTPTPKFEIDHDGGRVLRKDGKQIRWSTPLQGYLGLVRPPHLLWDGQRVYISHKDGVTALAAGTGRILWHSKGPNDRMLLKDKLLLATDCSVGEEVVASGRWLLARSVENGAEVFKVRLPAKDFDPLPIEEVAGLFLVQMMDAPGGQGNAILIDRQGKVRHRFNRQVVAGLVQGKGRVFLTSRDVVRLSADEKALWVRPFKRREWTAGGGMLEVGGDLVAFLYGRISDSGVQLVCLNGETGKVVWRAECAPLGVGHSQYSHDAEVKVEGNRLRVTSRGSSGTFVELLDLQTGKRLKRTVSKR
jgi:hypothetical protein